MSTFTYKTLTALALTGALLAAPAFADDLVLYTTRRRFADLTGSEDYNVVAAEAFNFDWPRPPDRRCRSRSPARR